MPDFITIANAHSTGGHKDNPDLHEFPLLCWAPAHEKHENKVFLEDGSATVENVALALSESSDLAVLAQRFGTTERHVSQAVMYALKHRLIPTK